MAHDTSSSRLVISYSAPRLNYIASKHQSTQDLQPAGTVSNSSIKYLFTNVSVHVVVLRAVCIWSMLHRYCATFVEMPLLCKLAA